MSAFLTGFLIDTDLLIDVLRGIEPTVSRLASLTGPVWFSVVTEAELWAGVGDGDEPAREALSTLLASMSPMPVDRPIARTAGRYRRKHKDQGTSLADALIAASASAHDLTLLTKNARHFPMADLRVETVSSTP